MTRIRTLGMTAALLAAALVGGTLISAVAAAPGRPATTAGDPVPAAEPTATATTGAAERKAKLEAYCATFQAAFAAELGKTQDEVTAAAKAAIGAAIDQAVKDGTITANAATRLKERVATLDGDGCKLLGGLRGKVGHRAAAKVMAVTRHALTAAAGSLGMTLPELREQLKAGKSLQDVATAKGVPYATVTTAATNAVKADLDAAVKDGTITQARADKILERFEKRLENGWAKPTR